MSKSKFNEGEKVLVDGKYLCLITSITKQEGKQGIHFSYNLKNLGAEGDKYYHRTDRTLTLYVEPPKPEPKPEPMPETIPEAVKPYNAVGYSIDLKVHPHVVNLTIYHNGKAINWGYSKIKEDTEVSLMQAISYAAHICYKKAEQAALEKEGNK